MRFASLLVCCFLSLSPSLFCQGSGYVQSSGVNIYYQCFGNGKPLLIINGGPGFSSEGFVPLAKKLSEKYMTIVFDQRGTGKSTMNTMDSTTITMDLMVADIEAIREKLKLKSWTVLGHSFGGMLGSYYISQHPERINGFISSASGGIDLSLLQFNGINEKLSAVQRDSVDFWRNKIRSGDTSYSARLGLGRNMAHAYVFNKRHLPAVAHRLTQGNMSLNALVWTDMRRIQYDTKTAAKHFTKPVLIIQGTEDVLDKSIAQLAVKTYPNASMLWLNNCGHYGWLDQPEAYFKGIDAFMKQVE